MLTTFTKGPSENHSSGRRCLIGKQNGAPNQALSLTGGYRGCVVPSRIDVYSARCPFIYKYHTDLLSFLILQHPVRPTNYLFQVLMEQTSSLDSITRQVMNTNPHHPQNWLDRCPAEILLNIFRFACSDDGTTGRALSLVSRRVSIISREVKLRALAIVGPKQIISSAKMLAETPLKHRRIIHLFIATIPQREKLTDIPLSSSFLLTRSGLTDQQVVCLLSLSYPAK